MRCINRLPHPQTVVPGQDTALFVALELSRSIWLVAVSAPHREIVSKYRIDAGNCEELRGLLQRLRLEAERRCKVPVKVISIHEAGLDAFWIHRMLEASGVESHVVDAASVEVNQRSRRVKTDRVDVEKLLRTLMGWARGERQICSMVQPPSPAQEDERRLTRERGTLIIERVRHTNRIKSLLATQGIFGFEPTHKDRRQRLEELRCWDGQLVPPYLKAELIRELCRLELVITQISSLEGERNRALELEQAFA